MGIINMFKSALLFASVSAIQLEGKPVQKKTKDIACHIGEGANGVGQSVCDIVKEAVDVKPWPRKGDAPEHDKQYYTGNTGDLPANPDGTLKKAEEEAPAKEEKKEEKKDAKKAEAKEGDKKEEAKEEKKEEAKAEEKKEEAAPAKEEAKK